MDTKACVDSAVVVCVLAVSISNSVRFMSPKCRWRMPLETHSFRVMTHRGRRGKVSDLASEANAYMYSPAQTPTLDVQSLEQSASCNVSLSAQVLCTGATGEYLKQMHITCEVQSLQALRHQYPFQFLHDVQSNTVVGPAITTLATLRRV